MLNRSLKMARIFCDFNDLQIFCNGNVWTLDAVLSGVNARNMGFEYRNSNIHI